MNKEEWAENLEILCKDAKKCFTDLTRLMGHLSILGVSDSEREILLATALIKLSKLDKEIGDICASK